MRRLAVLVSTVMLLAAVCLPAAAKDLAVVVQKSSPTKAVALPELVKIFKATTTKWPDGKEITVVMRDPSAPEMRMVLQKVYGMNADGVKSLISTANQAHKDRIVVLPTDDAVVKAVQALPAAVGITDIYSITSGVNVVKVDGKLPLEPGYALHVAQ